MPWSCLRFQLERRGPAMFLLIQQIFTQASEAVRGSGRSRRQGGRQGRFHLPHSVLNLAGRVGVVEELGKMRLEPVQSLQESGSFPFKNISSLPARPPPHPFPSPAPPNLSGAD